MVRLAKKCLAGRFINLETHRLCYNVCPYVSKVSREFHIDRTKIDCFLAMPSVKKHAPMREKWLPTSAKIEKIQTINKVYHNIMHSSG